MCCKFRLFEDSISTLDKPFSLSFLNSLAKKYPEFPLFWKKTATASVIELWKGGKHPSISYRAYPTWVCDISKADQGADAVLFLSAVFPFSYEITWAGRGRFPIQKKGSLPYIEITGTFLPSELLGRVIHIRANDPDSGIRADGKRFDRDLLLVSDLREWCSKQR